MGRWARGARRSVDYFYTVPNVDPKRITLSGHSRNSKQALVAAAFDERITAVVPSRGKSGDIEPWRFCTDMFVSELIEELTNGMPHWFPPRLRFFEGREHKLDVRAAVSEARKVYAHY